MLRIDPTTGLTVERTGRGLRDALLAVAIGCGVALGIGLHHRSASVRAVDGDADPMSVELRVPFGGPPHYHRALPPCPALHRCPALRAHPELLTELLPD